MQDAGCRKALSDVEGGSASQRARQGRGGNPQDSEVGPGPIEPTGLDMKDTTDRNLFETSLWDC
jgi:hypothetical protein